MEKLYFYEVDKQYISYLKQFESKIPNISYDLHDKFVCGVVLKVNESNYFAPISSFNKRQRTNFIILNENNLPISSIRFSFMFPCPSFSIRQKDISREEYRYQRLLMAELNYCNRNIRSIFDKALSIYNIGCNKNHLLNHLCCDFKLLEEKCLTYIEIQKSMEEAAPALDDKTQNSKNGRSASITEQIKKAQADQHKEQAQVKNKDSSHKKER